MIFKIDCKFDVEVKSSDLKHLMLAFMKAQTKLFEVFVRDVLLYFFEEYYKTGQLGSILGIKDYRKKSHSKLTKFKTLFGTIYVPQIQIRVKLKNNKEYQLSITRTLLGISPRFQIPDFMKEFLGWIGAVTTYRVAHQIVGLLTNFKCSLMSVWHSVQWHGKRIKLELAQNGTNEFECDGTGVPTKNSGKRGSELKKTFQRKKDGKLQLVGLSIGKYKSKTDWIECMSGITIAIESKLEKYSKIILATDGDLSIINAAKSISNKIKIQKDKWHVFHQLKYYLWKDGITKESRSEFIAHYYALTMLSKDSSSVRDKSIMTYINSLSSKQYGATKVYLESAMNGFYTHEQEGNTNIYTSKTERSMRTTNQRINVGVWSDDGALNVCKIRGAHYYNGINPLKWKEIA